eukprot:scaffold9068_cov38-Cyclotella_meneghiniana.AAC.3
MSISRDECIEENAKANYDSDVLNRINATGLPPHRLPLCVGACIILIRNMDPDKGHMNGTRYKILQLMPQLIKAEKLDGDGGPNDIVLIPRIPCTRKKQASQLHGKEYSSLYSLHTTLQLQEFKDKHLNTLELTYLRVCLVMDSFILPNRDADYNDAHVMASEVEALASEVVARVMREWNHGGIIRSGYCALLRRCRTLLEVQKERNNALKFTFDFLMNVRRPIVP